MKKFRKATAILLTMLMLTCSLTVSTSAQENTVFTVKMINYNVAGLPSFGGRDAAGSHTAIAEYIVANGYDIVAVQEDFAYHRNLINGLDGYEYQTNHTGSIPGGDGLNIFTKTMPLYNEVRYEWDVLFGSLAEGDTLTPKGILHTVIDVGNGVYVDFYNIHADAFDTEGSIAARESNFNQLADLIDENYEKYGRPVIVTGDFNASLHNAGLTGNMYEIFMERCGLKDAWIELENGGNYSDFTSWIEQGVDWWGNWDSVEKVMYKDGRGVTVNAVDFEYKMLTNGDGELLSDHAAAECVLEFGITDEFVSDSTGLEIVKVSPLRNFFNLIKWIFKDLYTAFTSLDEFPELLS